MKWATFGVIALATAWSVEAFLFPAAPAGQSNSNQNELLLPRKGARSSTPRVMKQQPVGSSISDFLDNAEVDITGSDSGPKGSGAAPGGSVQYFVRCGRCNAAYEVGADLVKPEGGRVKCEVCGHTWFQASNRLQVLSDGYILKNYPDDLREKVAENVKNNRHPLDTSGQKGAISVFVGNLPFSLDEDGVKEMFGEFGKVVSVTIVKDQLNRSKGFGFVEMAVKEDGEAAIAALDGKEIDGRPINVRLGTSKPQPRMRKDRSNQRREQPKSESGGATGDLSSLLEDDDA